MRGNVIGLVALDLVLRIALRGVMRMPLVIKISRVDSDDPAGDMPRFRVPTYVIADLEPLRHRL